MRRITLRRRLAFAIAGALAFLIGLLSTIRSAPAQQPERFDLKVRQDFFTGFAGNKEALARGMKSCEDTLAMNPKNAQALVWHGGGLLFVAGESFQSGDAAHGGEQFARGLKEMQTGVDLEPDTLGTRIPRGATLFATSRFVPADQARPMIQDAIADYEHAYDLQKSHFSTIGTHPRGELLFGLAEGYSRLGEEEKARAYFEKIRKELPDTTYSKRARLWLETKTLPVNQTGCVGCHVPNAKR